MKRIGAFSLAIIIFTLSIVLYVPDITFANEAFIISKNSDEATGLSSDEAQKAIDANADIRGKDGVTMLLYTPSDSYNYTLKSGAFVCHMSDAQAKAMLMSKKSFQQYVVLVSSLLSNNSVIRGFVSTVGALTTENSKTLTDILDSVTGNYNYLDSLNYDEDSQTVTMSNLNGSVDKLREEIKKYYYIENGMFYYKPYGAFSNVVSTSSYSDMTLYQEDYNLLQNYDYAFKTSNYILAFNKSDFNSFYFTGSYNSFDSGGSNCLIQFVDNDFNSIDLNFNSNFNYVSDTYGAYSYHSVGFHSSGYNSHYWIKDTLSSSACWGGSNSFVYYFNTDNKEHSWQYGEFYSKDNSDLLGFVSYEALYNYFHGDKNAYLSSRIDKAGEDISFSIKDMSENLGEKMDTLIDSINDKKGSMSADELQNAIDKGIEDLNKNTEDIKDNTSSILDKLEEQNQILLQILGVTEYIAYQTTKDDGSSYTKTDLTNTINKIYNGLGNAILYGKNTLTDSGDSSGAASQSSIVTREDFKLSNNIYTSSGSGVSPGTPVVAYSLDDYSVYDVSNDYDVGISTQDINNMDIHDGLFGKFPFSVPYQLYEWLQVLQADPVAPKLVYNYGFLLGHKDDQKYDLVIDFNIYEPWANVCKSFLRLSFTLAMSLFLYKKFKGNSIF